MVGLAAEEGDTRAEWLNPGPTQQGMAAAVEEEVALPTAAIQALVATVVPVSFRSFGITRRSFTRERG